MLIKNTSILEKCPLGCVSTSLMNNIWTIMFPSDYLGHGDKWGFEEFSHAWGRTFLDFCAPLFLSPCLIYFLGFSNCRIILGRLNWFYCIFLRERFFSPSFLMNAFQRKVGQSIKGGLSRPWDLGFHIPQPQCLAKLWRG